MTEAEVQLTVKFITKLPVTYTIPDTPLVSPITASWRRALSKIVNHVLQSDTPQPFDFVVEGKLLRTSLQDHFAQQSLSVEGVIEIEYIPVILPPKDRRTATHDDWISSIHARAHPLLSASYDGTVKGWTSKLECVWSIAAHEAPVMDVKRVPGHEMFLTASLDFDVKAWSLEETPPKPLATLKGNTAGVTAVCPSPDGERCCSVGWGEGMHMWPSGDSLLQHEGEESDTDITAKRQRTETGGQHDKDIKKIGPLGLLAGHQGCVSDVIWPRKHSLFTGGWDHTVRKWDAPSGTSSEMLTTHRVVHCVAAPPDGAAVVAFGSSDAILRLWDARERSESISVKLYRSHSSWITAISWSPISAYHIATASHDASVRLWDIRGTVPLISSTHHSHKCLAVDWGPSDWTLLSGGADCCLHTCDVDVSIT